MDVGDKVVYMRRVAFDPGDKSARSQPTLFCSLRVENSLNVECNLLAPSIEASLIALSTRRSVGGLIHLNLVIFVDVEDAAVWTKHLACDRPPWSACGREAERDKVRHFPNFWDCKPIVHLIDRGVIGVTVGFEVAAQGERRHCSPFAGVHEYSACAKERKSEVTYTCEKVNNDAASAIQGGIAHPLRVVAK